MAGRRRNGESKVGGWTLVTRWPGWGGRREGGREGWEENLEKEQREPGDTGKKWEHNNWRAGGREGRRRGVPQQLTGALRSLGTPNTKGSPDECFCLCC